MGSEFHEGDFAGQRRATRIGVELPVRCKCGLLRSTVMLKDMTRHGARIEGIGQQRVGESVTLLLPGLPAVTAFVIWSDPATSGLEFLTPLPIEPYERLIGDYAIGHVPLMPRTQPAAHRYAA